MTQRRSLCWGLLLLALTALQLCAAQVNFAGGNPPKSTPRKEDIPFIKCQVCEAIVKQALTAVKELRDKVTPGKPLTEADIIEGLETMCNPESSAGEWIRRYDLQEDGDSLKLVDMGQVGKCTDECRTIAKACEDISEHIDLSDMSELLYKGSKRSALSQWACWEESKACLKKPPSLPKDRTPGPAFEPVDESTLNTERLMRKMQASGMKGTMYDRESIQQQLANEGGGGLLGGEGGDAGEL